MQFIIVLSFFIVLVLVFSDSLQISISQPLSKDVKMHHRFSRNILEFVKSNIGTFLDELSFVSFEKNDKQTNMVLHCLFNRKISRGFLHSNSAMFTSAFIADSVTNPSHIVQNLTKNFIAIASASLSNSWPKYLDLISKSKANCAILVFTGNFDTDKESRLQKIVKNMSGNSMFYILYFKYREFLWYRTITLQGYKQSVLNLLKFDSNGKIIEYYDMQGLHIVSTTLTWAPYFTLDCAINQHKSCKSDGYLAEIMDILGGMMNFTWEAPAEKNGNWGTKPTSGPANSSGVWGGIVGDVLRGNYQISIR